VTALTPLTVSDVPKGFEGQSERKRVSGSGRKVKQGDRRVWDNGIKLYGEADAYQTVCGILLSRLKPVHNDDVSVVLRVYFSAISALYHSFYTTVQGYKTKPVYERYRLNYTITALRDIKRRFVKTANKELQSHVWKG